MQKIKRIFLVTAAAAAIVSVFALPGVSQAKVKLNKKKLSLYVKTSEKLKLKKAGKHVKWVSSDKKKIKVNKKGKVTALKPGKAVIKAVYKGKKYKCHVTAGKYAGSVSVRADVVSLKKGQVAGISAEVSPAKVLYKGFKYESENGSVATVSEDGIIKAVSSGETHIVVTSASSDKKGNPVSARVTVSVAPDVDVKTVVPPLSSSEVDEVMYNGAATGTSVKSDISSEISNIKKSTFRNVLKARLLVNSSGKYTTLYFLDRNYTGKINISVLGHSLADDGRLTDTLSTITKLSDIGVSSRADSSGNSVYVEDNLGNCKVTQYLNGTATSKSIYFSVYEIDRFYGLGDSTALIVAEGDTREDIVVN